MLQARFLSFISATNHVKTKWTKSSRTVDEGERYRYQLNKTHSFLSLCVRNF